MVICKGKIVVHTILCTFLIFVFINSSYADLTFKKLENKKVSYLDFFLLKFESTLLKKSQILRRQAVITRVQYSNIGIQVDFDDKREQIFINIHAVMDRQRYKKKNYEQKLRDCNQVRNLIFYQKHGYKFFSQKRDPSLSQNVMESIFKEVFLNNLSFNEKEIEFLLNKMFIEVSIYHPIKKTELTCSGKVNDYELK